MKKYVTVLAVIKVMLTSNIIIYSEQTYPLHDKTPLDVIKYFNYYGEEHVIETEDGYFLVMHRITGTIKTPSPIKKAVVLLQHGLFSSSMDWIITGPNQSLAFMLVDYGFDVWMGNFRGNTYSRKHKSLLQNDSAYWNFSWHELGIIDLPAMINHILDHTVHNKINFVGHSQANTASYVLLSERPYYNSKIKALYSLSPVSFFLHGDIRLKAATLFFDQFNRLSLIKITGFIFDREQKKLIKKLCQINMFTSMYCKSVMVGIYSSGQDQFNEEMMDLVWEYHPSGCSFKQVVHYSQLILSGRFAKFNYGNETNWNKYNSSDPPDYNLINIKIPVYLIYSPSDIFTITEDARELYKHLVNPAGLYKIKNEGFNHYDFLWAKNVSTLLYDHLIKLVLEQQKNMASELANATSLTTALRLGRSAANEDKV